MGQNILEQMIERNHNRQGQWKFEEVAELPDPYTLQEITLLGSYSYTGIQTRRRMLVRSDLVHLDNDHADTPPAIARDYLTLKYTRGTHPKQVQLDALTGHLRPAPSYAKPGKFAHGYYIDIKSTYWSIMQAIGWNVDYWPEKWISPGAPPDDFPFPDHKIARNCLVSAGVPRPITRFVPTKSPDPFDQIFPSSHLTNYGLWRLVGDVLNAIAAQAVDFGAIYVNTDGFIATTNKSAAQIIGLISDYGLTARVKAEGAGSVKSCGAYAVGTTISRPWKSRGQEVEEHAIYPPRYHRWLQDRFAFWVAENT